MRKLSNTQKIIICSAVIFSVFLTCVLSLFNFNWHDFFSKIQITSVITNNNLPYDLNVHFLNVGKADCVYINHKNKNYNYNILIDAGDKEPFSTVTEYLKKQGVKKLDLVIISHPHRDHIGQIPEILREFKVSKFIEPDIPENLVPTTMTYQNILHELQKRKINSEIVTHGKNYVLGDLYLEIFGPVSHNENLNNNSIVLKLNYKNISFLFTGDAEKAEESQILNKNYDVKSDVLKVAHHGSRTSSTIKFIEKVAPKYCVISVAPDKSNLPKPDIIKRLKKISEEIYRTDLHGNIIFSTDGENIEIFTQK